MQIPETFSLFISNYENEAMRRDPIGETVRLLRSVADHLETEQHFAAVDGMPLGDRNGDKIGETLVNFEDNTLIGGERAEKPFAELYRLVLEMLAETDEAHLKRVIKSAHAGRVRSPITSENLHLFRKFRNEESPDAAVLITLAKASVRG